MVNGQEEKKDEDLFAVYAVRKNELAGPIELSNILRLDLSH